MTEMTAELVRQKLFTAISEGKFDRVPAIAAAYRETVVRSTVKLEEALHPLNEALRYLQLVRAYQSAQFHKLSAGALYRRYSNLDR